MNTQRLIGELTQIAAEVSFGNSTRLQQAKMLEKLIEEIKEDEEAEAEYMGHRCTETPNKGGDYMVRLVKGLSLMDNR